MDTPETSIEFFIALFFVFLTGITTLLERSIAGARGSELEKKADDGDTRVATVLRLLDDPQQPLSVILFSKILFIILTGAAIMFTLTPQLAQYLEQLAPIAAYSGHIAVIAGTVLTAFTVMIGGELIPRLIAMNYPEDTLIKLFPLIRAMTAALKPLACLFVAIAKFIGLMFSIRTSPQTQVTEDRVRTLIEQGTEDGIFEKTEQDMVDQVFRLNDLKVGALMTPRTQMYWLDLDESLADNLEIIKNNPDIIYPVGSDSLDNFVGVVFTSDLLKLSLDSPIINLCDCIKQPLFIPKTMSVLNALELFKRKSVNEAIVVDEFSGVVGFVTIRDIFDEMLTDLAGGDMTDMPQIISYGQDAWLVDGLLPIDDFKEHFDLDGLPEEDRDQYQTMGGFIVSYLGYIPKPTDKFTWNNYSFEIIDMDRVRVDKILVRRLPAAEVSMAS